MKISKKNYFEKIALFFRLYLASLKLAGRRASWIFSALVFLESCSVIQMRLHRRLMRYQKTIEKRLAKVSEAVAMEKPLEVVCRYRV